MSNETALQMIDAAVKQGALVCFDRANGFPQVDLYRTEITEIKINKETDCYFISKKYMPKKEIVDRIGEAAGVIFTMGETNISTIDDPTCGKHTIYTGIAQGKVRMPDGTWRISSVCDYEFDPTLRAMLDYAVTELTPETKQKKKTWKNEDGSTKPYGNPLAVAILEYQKTARQRANTGARLRVIRELVGLPIALTEDQVKKPVLFGRIVQNTNYILQTPEGRAMATAQALGVDVATLFGKPSLPPATDNEDDAAHTPTETSNLKPEQESENQSNTADLAAQAVDDDVDFPADEGEAPQEDSEFVRLTSALEEFLTYKEHLNIKVSSGVNPYELAMIELNSKTATIESRKKMIDRIRDFLTKKKVQGVA